MDIEKNDEYERCIAYEERVLDDELDQLELEERFARGEFDEP